MMFRFISCLLLCLAFSSCQTNSNPKESWISLFNGTSLEGWERANFGGDGDVSVENQMIRVDFGVRQSGIRYTKALPSKINYEVELEARREDGNDFFCGLSFPVAEEQCSLIVGGWGGGVVGLSNINDEDASKNETNLTLFHENNQWHTIRLRVESEKILVWINGKKVIDVSTINKKLSVRPEMDPVLPFGISSFQSRCSYRNIKFRQI